MGTDCCERDQAGAGGVEAAASSACPGCGVPGPTVPHETVAALTHARVPARQRFRICRSPDCPVVYHGDGGAVRTLEDLHLRPGFKTGGDLVCYCFLYTSTQIAAEVSKRGGSGVPAEIRRRVNAGDCACRVRNPSGRCCLGEVERTVERCEAAMATGAGE